MMDRPGRGDVDLLRGVAEDDDPRRAPGGDARAAAMSRRGEPPETCPRAA
jgi:hypothetical protein